MKTETLSRDLLAEDYFEALHHAHRSLRSAFASREACGLTQDRLAAILNLDKALISRRLSGRENLTLKTLSHMASALDCKLQVDFLPHEDIRASNHYSSSWRNLPPTLKYRAEVEKSSAIQEASHHQSPNAPQSRLKRKSHAVAELIRLRSAVAAKAVP